MTDYKFGRLEPTSEKLSQNNVYSFNILGLKTPDKIEKSLPYPKSYASWYDQGNKNACVGYSCSWMTTINNYVERKIPIKYDALWLYKQALLKDNDPSTTFEEDTGTYLWSGFDVLRKYGHRRILDNSDVSLYENLAEGIDNYYWIKTIDELRTAFTLDRPVVFGINWYSEFNDPKLVNDEYWIGSSLKWGNLVGGHAICSCEISDDREAVRLLNTWGNRYPPVWISYKSIEKLLAKNGEAGVAIDKKDAVVIPIPAEKGYYDITIVNSAGKKFSGRLLEE